MGSYEPGLRAVGGVDHAPDQVVRLRAFLREHAGWTAGLEKGMWIARDGAGERRGCAYMLRELLDALGAP
jgi:hypothetical protein